MNLCISYYWLPFILQNKTLIQERIGYLAKEREYRKTYNVDQKMFGYLDIFRTKIVRDKLKGFEW